MRHPVEPLRPSRALKPLRRFLAIFLLIGALASAPAFPQGSFNPWQFWTEVSVHQIHLPSDQILLWAYSGYSAWVWDVGTLLPLNETPNLSANIFCSGHAGLADGSYLVAGGINLPAGPFNANVAEKFDVPTGTWITQTNMAANRFYPTVTTLGDGRVIAVGGTGNMSDIPEIFDPATNTWTQLPGAQLPMGVYPFMFLLPNGKLFFSGPGTNTGTLDIPTQTWTFGIPSTNDGASAVMYEPGKVMKCGGFAAATAATETIDMTAATPTWTAALPMAFQRHDHSLTILPDGTVLAVGGHDSAGLSVLPAELFDPQTGAWTTMASLGIPRRYHSTSMLLRDGRVLVGGGDGFASVEVYNPPYLSAGGTRPEITSSPAQVTYNRTFHVKWTATSIIQRVTLLRLGAETHSFDQNQRFQELSFQVTGPLGITPSGLILGTVSVTAPSGGNVAPPGYYMLFVLDNQGVPSIGAYLQIL